MNRPSSVWSLRWTKACGGSHSVIVVTGWYPPKAIRTAPPAPGSTWLRPMNQESMPGPVAIACHTSSGVAGTSASFRPSNARPISAVLLWLGVLRLGVLWLGVRWLGVARRAAGMHRDDH